MAVCPTDFELEAVLEGTATGDEEAWVIDHLERCVGCRTQLLSKAGSSEEFKILATQNGEQAPLLAVWMQAMTSTSSASDEAKESGIRERLSRSDCPGSLGRFGNYEILAEVDSGSMGVLLKARDAQLNRVIALKILSPTLGSSSSARKRFTREARSVAAIQHDNVVTIHAVGEAQGLPYIAMEFVEGESLARRLEREGRLPAAEVVRIGKEIASGLAAAHARGIVHRDIKPANILIEGGTGRARITDFGLARALDDTGLTRSGFIAGTPEYLSPEQVAGEPLNHRADLFSLGCVLFEMCAGHSPFRADSTLAILRKIADYTPPPIAAINSQIPHWLGKIITRLLAKQPEARFQNAQQLIAAMDHGDDGTNEKSPAWKRRLVATTVAGSALALVAMAIIVPRTSRRPVSVRSSPRHDSPVALSAPVEMRSAASSTASFVVGNDAGVFGRAFSDIKQAIQAAEPGAVIECRFTGDWPIEPIDLGEKPLIIRAVANTKPAFLITRRPGPLLRTRAPLTLEGLTFKVPALESRPSLTSYRSPFNEPVIESSNAPLCMANCRIELVGPLGGNLDGGCCVGLLDNSFAAFENCEFYAPINGGIGHLHTAASLRTASGRDRIIIRNCVQTGFALVHPKDSQGREMLIELTRNTTAIGSCAVGFTQPPGAGPITILASQNVFDVDYVVGSQPPARVRPADALLRWMDATNLINVKEGFTRTQPPLTTAEQWRSFIGGSDGAPITVELGLSHRIMNLRTDMSQFRPEWFLLSAAEKEQLEEIVPGLSDTLGVQPEICGPGEPYDRWKRSPAYADWGKKAHQLLRTQR
jgi:serine/threonine protein kinase